MIDLEDRIVHSPGSKQAESTPLTHTHSNGTPPRPLTITTLAGHSTPVGERRGSNDTAARRPTAMMIASAQARRFMRRRERPARGCPGRNRSRWPAAGADAGDGGVSRDGGEHAGTTHDERQGKSGPEQQGPDRGPGEHQHDRSRTTSEAKIAATSERWVGGQVRQRERE